MWIRVAGLIELPRRYNCVLYFPRARRATAGLQIGLYEDSGGPFRADLCSRVSITSISSCGLLDQSLTDPRTLNSATNLPV